MDNLSIAERKYCMSRIKMSNTRPELIFRKLIWRYGIRGYRLKSNILGKPDLYFPKLKIAVFIDGCFWHKCPKCFKKPKSNLKYWNKKIETNVNRDKFVNSRLKKEGIRVKRIWEHDVKNVDKFLRYYEKIQNN